MARSPLTGEVDRARLEPEGRDTAALGPSDTSDSGSDLTGIEQLDDNDPGMPVDKALERDIERSFTGGAVRDGASGDAAGTGERGAAASDDPDREAADISVDRVFDPLAEGTELDEDEDPDLGFVDRAQAELEGSGDEEEEDEDADPVGDGASDANLAG